MKRPIGMMPALLTSTSIGPSCSSARSRNAAKDARSVTSSGSATVLAPSSVGGVACRVEVHIADRDLHSLAQKRLRRRLADPTRGTGDRHGLSGEDSGLLGHMCPPGGGRLSHPKASATNANIAEITASSALAQGFNVQIIR